MAQRAAGYPVKIKGDGNKKHRDWIQRAHLRLTAGKRYRNIMRETTWVRSENQYEGKHWPEASGLDQIVINMSFATANVIVPYMTGSEPNFLVLPMGQGATPRNAAIQQAMLNRQWRAELKGQEEIESGSTDFIIYGDGYFKSGYSIVERRVDGEEATYAEVAELWMKRIDPWDVWIDPASDGIHNARWVAHRVLLTRDEVEKSAYANKDQITYSAHVDVEETTRTNQPTHTVLDGEEFAVVYEFYDMVNNYMVAFTENGDFALAVIEDLPECPIVQMGNYRIPNSPYHMGELEQLWSIQRELNKTRSQMLQHRARNAQKYVAKKGVLDAAAKQALRSQEVNVVIELENVEGDLANYLAPMQVTNLSGDVYNVSDILIRDIYEISGVNEYLRGATPQTTRTATEATIIEGASNAKSQQKLRQIEKALARIGTLLLGFAADVYPLTDFEEMQLYLTGRDAQLVARNDDPMNVLDDMGEPMDPTTVTNAVVSPSPEVFVGTYEVLVESGSTELRNPVMREQKYRGIVMDLLGALPMLSQMGVNLDVRKLLLLWFESAGIDDVEGLFQDAPQPGLMPGRADVELFGQLDPAALQSLLGPALGGQPDEILQAPPDEIMGGFTSENTGMLEPIA